MKVALVFPFYTSRVFRPDDVLDAYPIVRCLPLSIARNGNDVHVFLQSPRSSTTARCGIEYEFVAANSAMRLAARAVFRWRGNLAPAYYEPIFRLAHSVAQFQPDIVHFFGLTMDIQLAHIARMCERGSIPLVVHFHGGLPATGHRWHIQRHNLARVDRVLFTTDEQVDVWTAAGLIPDKRRVAIVMETSSALQQRPRDDARQRTGMYGNPVCLSVGRLHEIKDPLTMLRGFARFARDHPRARLYLHYLTNELIDAAHEYVASVPGLIDRVEFRGRARPDEMAAIYSSADILLQASTREWSGLAVLEAMSCGCIPVVSDIPSFRSMTANGRYGRLFTVGDSENLAAALQDVWSHDTRQLANDVVAHFTTDLSFAAMARRLNDIYREACRTTGNG